MVCPLRVNLRHGRPAGECLVLPWKQTSQTVAALTAGDRRGFPLSARWVQRDLRGSRHVMVDLKQIVYVGPQGRAAAAIKLKGRVNPAYLHRVPRSARSTDGLDRACILDHDTRSSFLRL